MSMKRIKQITQKICERYPMGTKGYNYDFLQKRKRNISNAKKILMEQNTNEIKEQNKKMFETLSKI